MDSFSSVPLEPHRTARLVSRDSLTLGAVALFGAASYFGPPEGFGIHASTVFALVGFSVLMVALFAPDNNRVSKPVPALLIASGFLLTRFVEPFLPGGSPAIQVLLFLAFPVAITLASASAWWAGASRGLFAASALMFALVFGGMVIILGVPSPVIDTILAHEAAADSLSRGQHPYGDAVLIYSPGAQPTETIVGYPYPPLVALAFGLSELILGDSRWISVAALCGIVCALVLGQTSTNRLAVAAAILLITLPGLPIVVALAFTECLTALLVVWALVVWNKRPNFSAVLVGLALASKQYTVVLLPIFLLPAIRTGWRRPTLMVSTAAATVLPMVIIDWGAFFRSTVENLASVPIRPGSSSLQGLLFNLGVDLTLPIVLTVGLPIALAWFLSSRVKTPRDQALSLGIALTAFFLLARNTTINYWFLVAMIAILAYGLPTGGDVKSERGQVWSRSEASTEKGRPPG